MGSPTGSWLAAHMADLTLYLHISLSHGSTLLRFYSQWSLSVNVFHDIFGCRAGPCFPSICMSQAVLIASLEHSTCPNQRSLFSFRITLRSSISSCANSSFDPIVAISSGLTLQIWLIMALSFRFVLLLAFVCLHDKLEHDHKLWPVGTILPNNFAHQYW